MADSGMILYEGPSLLTGDPIVAIATGLDGGSLNPKTGPMVQTWVLCRDLMPMEAKRQNVDDAICGDCKLRGRNGKDSGCYLTVWFGPTQVYKRYVAGAYPRATWREQHALIEGRSVRLCAYGDPAAVPFEVWQTVLRTAGTHTGYTHSWRTCDTRFKAILMASVDSEPEFFEAGLRGWRTFRIRLADEPLIAGAEFACPASDEMRHRATCQSCRLCRGTSSPARSVAIVAHGKPSSLRAFGIPATFFGRKASQKESDNNARTIREVHA
jgi:hypothetical protein